MIECVCDICTKIAGTEAYHITVAEISNKSRYSVGAPINPNIETKRKAGMIICPTCYAKLKLPTIDDLIKKDDRKWEGSNG